MSDLNLDNITWDLEGLVSLDELKLDFTDIELLINRFKTTNNYSRYVGLDLPIEFTTSETIFNKTGLFKIVYEPYFDVSKLVLIGTTDILYYYFKQKKLSDKFTLYYDVKITDNIKYNNYLSISDFKYLFINHNIKDFSYFSTLLDINKPVTNHALMDLLLFLMYYDTYLSTTLIVEFDELSNLSEYDGYLYLLSLLSSYCYSIEIKINRLYVSHFKSLPMNIRNLLFSYNNIKMQKIMYIDYSGCEPFSLDESRIINISNHLKTTLFSM